MLTEPADINSIYEESLANLRDRIPIDDGKGRGGLSIAEKEHQAKEYYASVRTNVLLAWVLSNVSQARLGLLETEADGCAVGTAVGDYSEWE